MSVLFYQIGEMKIKISIPNITVGINLFSLRVGGSKRAWEQPGGTDH